MKIREIRNLTGLSQSKFAEKYSIPLSTLQHWERDYTQPPKYFLELLKNTIGLETQGVMNFTGKNGELYIYYSDTQIISNLNGDSVHVTKTIEDVKKENIGLYLSDMFDYLEQAKKMFAIDCEEDLRSDIIWIEN